MAHLTEELGFAFSIYGNPITHRSKLGTHYTKLTRPVVRQNPLTTAAVGVWFGLVKPKVHRVRRRLEMP
jgi:hypothetical protein